MRDLLKLLCVLLILGGCVWPWVCWFAQSDKPLREVEESIDWNPSEGKRSSGWRQVRDRFVEKNPVCVACGSSVALNVHHVRPVSKFPKLELVESNLITLCRDHHFHLGHDPDGPWSPKKASWSEWNPRVREHAAQVARGRKIK